MDHDDLERGPRLVVIGFLLAIAALLMLARVL